MQTTVQLGAPTRSGEERSAVGFSAGLSVVRHPVRRQRKGREGEQLSLCPRKGESTARGSRSPKTKMSSAGKRKTAVWMHIT